MSHNPEHLSTQKFRELNPVPQWSGKITLDIPFDQFQSTVLEAAAAAGHRYTGFITRNPKTGNVASFTRTVYPRLQYGQPPDPDSCLAYMDYLAGLFNTRLEPDNQYANGFSRIVLGLYEGQHKDGMRPDLTEHTADELQQALGDNAFVIPGEVFTTRFSQDDGMSYSHKPVGIVLTPTSMKQAVYELGDAISQERFTVEDFMEQRGDAYMVETRHCKTPDYLS